MSEQGISNEQLRHRITGAILLVILGIVAIPLFLGEPKNFDPVDSEATLSEPFESVIQSPEPATAIVDDSELTLVPNQPNLSDELVTPTPIQSPASIVTNKPAEKKAQSVSQPKPLVRPAAKPALKASVQKGWAVQVGVFSKRTNAAAIADILSSKGYKGKLSSAGSNNAHTRVWLGPFATKEQAQTASAKLKASQGDGGFVKSFPFTN